jgi:hypothetical protein
MAVDTRTRGNKVYELVMRHENKDYPANQKSAYPDSFITWEARGVRIQGHYTHPTHAR